jgi:hypothetical protein
VKFRPVGRFLRHGDAENINGTSESQWGGFAEGFYFGDAAFVCGDIAGYAFPDELGLDAEEGAGKLCFSTDTEDGDGCRKSEK